MNEPKRKEEFLWHKTPQWRVDQILTNGLSPRRSASSIKAVFLTDGHSLRRLGVELGIRKGMLNPDKLVVDEVLQSGITHYKYFDDIPPSAIFVIDVTVPN